MAPKELGAVSGTNNTIVELLSTKREAWLVAPNAHHLLLVERTIRCAVLRVAWIARIPGDAPVAPVTLAKRPAAVRLVACVELGLADALLPVAKTLLASERPLRITRPALWTNIGGCPSLGGSARSTFLSVAGIATGDEGDAEEKQAPAQVHEESSLAYVGSGVVSLSSRAVSLVLGSFARIPNLLATQVSSWSGLAPLWTKMPATHVFATGRKLTAHIATYFPASPEATAAQVITMCH